MELGFGLCEAEKGGGREEEELGNVLCRRTSRSGWLFDFVCDMILMGGSFMYMYSMHLTFNQEKDVRLEDQSIVSYLSQSPPSL